MDFKEAYQEDIDQTFFDMEEFASAHVIDYTLYIRDKDMRKKVTTNAVINLDGKNYFVQSVDHADGIYKLIIGGHAV